MGQNLIFGILFLKILFRTYNFSMFVQSCQWTLLEFFLILDLLAETLKAKKDHSFYNEVLLKKSLSHFTILNSLGIGDNMAKKFSEFTNFLRLQSLHIPFAVSKNNNNNKNKTKTKNKTKQKTFALHHFLKAKNCIPVCIFLYIFMSVYLREKFFVPETY